jgi:hypothetical protein
MQGRMEWTFVRVMLGCVSFAGMALVVGAKRFIMTNSLALKASGASHVSWKDLINEKCWGFLCSEGRYVTRRRHRGRKVYYS